jgi:hypothetical protein
MDEFSKQMKQREFLDAIRENPTVRHACDKANVSRETYREWVKDPVFAQEMEDAKDDAADKVEERLFVIACGMDRKPKFDRNDNPIMVLDESGAPVQAFETYRSDAITMLVARALRPDQYADKVEFDASLLTNEQIMAFKRREREKPKVKG